MASKRLTNYLRNAFVEAVSADIPEPPHPSRETLQQEAVAAMPKPFQEIYEDPDLRKWLPRNGMYIDSDWVTVFSLSEINKLPSMQAYYKADEVREQAIKSLKTVAASCGTVDQLRKALPELESYMPSENAAPTKNLPVLANTITALMDAGFKGFLKTA